MDAPEPPSLPPPILPPAPPAVPPALPVPLPKSNTLAVFSVVLGVAGFLVPIGALAAIVCGHLSLSRIKRSAGQLGGETASVVGLVIGYFVVVIYTALVVFLITGAVTFGKWAQKASAAATERELARVTVPHFPELQGWQTLPRSQIRVAQVDFAAVNPGADAGPGQQMKMRVYLPAGEHAPHSLSCVLIAPAGTSMLTGADLDRLDGNAYHAEARPYAEAGLAVITYSLDGDFNKSDKTNIATRFGGAYRAFKAAGGGVINGRNALEFALRRLPEVNPKRIFSAGHSSAGTVSLLFAAHEPRLRGCIAFAPGADVEEHTKEVLKTPALELVLPGVHKFARETSPMNQTEKMPMPVFVFQAKDDSKVPFATTTRFVEKLRETNRDVTFESVEEGDHYEPMIEKGIPLAIEWIRRVNADEEGPKKRVVK